MGRNWRYVLYIYLAGALIMEAMLVLDAYGNGGFQRQHSLVDLIIIAALYLASAALWPLLGREPINLPGVGLLESAMPRQRLNSAAQRNDAKSHFRTSAPALRASATPNIVRRSAETARYIRSIGAYYRPHKQFRLHREPLSSDSQRLFSLRNARTTPMDRERPDQGLPESMLSMVW
jgi:hypothetical protein